MTAPIYLERETLKESKGLKNTDFKDEKIDRSLSAASRGIDRWCSTRFYIPEDSNDETRWYSAMECWYVDIDDLAAFTSLRVDTTGNGTFVDTLVENRDFVLLPLNALAKGEPFNRIEAQEAHGARWFPIYRRGIQVTGRFGWLETPPEVISATELLAERILKRSDVPFAVIATVDGAARIAGTDPDVRSLLEPFIRTPMVA